MGRTYSSETFELESDEKYFFQEKIMFDFAGDVCMNIMTIADLNPCLI